MHDLCAGVMVILSRHPLKPSKSVITRFGMQIAYIQNYNLRTPFSYDYGTV